MGVQIRSKDPLVIKVCSRYWAHSEKYRFLENIEDIAGDLAINKTKVFEIVKQHSQYRMEQHACGKCGFITVAYGRLDLTQQVAREGLCVRCAKGGASAPLKPLTPRALVSSHQHAPTMGLKDSIYLSAILDASRDLGDRQLSGPSESWSVISSTEGLTISAYDHCVKQGLIERLAGASGAAQYVIKREASECGLGRFKEAVKGRWLPQWEVDAVELDLKIKTDEAIREIALMFAKDGFVFSESPTLRKSISGLLSAKSVSVAQVCMSCYITLRSTAAWLEKADRVADRNAWLNKVIDQKIIKQVDYMAERNREIKEWHRTGGFTQMPLIATKLYGEIRGDLKGWWTANKQSVVNGE